jgi:tRNA (mo5U34)-methyltransferase
MPPQQTLSQQDLEKQIRDLAPWFHNIEINGIRTAPDHFLGDYPNLKWTKFADALPGDLSGKTVLDIGCNAGFYSIEMLKRGAERVVGIDTDPHFLAQARLVTDFYDADVDLHQMSIYDVAKLGEKFDVVLCLGVFYHLRHPLLALDLLHEHVVKDMLVFQTLQRGSSEVQDLDANYDFWATEMFDKPGFPRMSFIEHRYADDITNWWFPNHAGTEAMLRSAGFEIEQHPEEEVYICRWCELSEWDKTDRAVYPARSANG